MLPELAHFSLILALLIALMQTVLPLVGSLTAYSKLTQSAKPLALTQFAFVAFAWGTLAYAFVQSDFSVLNVAQNSNSELPWFYRFAATWGSHEGSILLWVLMLSGWGATVVLFSKNLPASLLARVLAVLGAIGVGFLLFLLLTSNPFTRLLPAALEGSDLNPLLQDPGMVIHPPMLYMGYVGFSVAFAFAIAALIGGELDAVWARWTRPWTLVAWSFLTVGIALGSWWAYSVLGWGGWWFWDPVENASFMPWLTGTALIHSLAVTEKRGVLKSWTVLLAILAFSLSLLGTFLVRSGVLTSVHAFASDPTRGKFILLFLVTVIGGSLSLYAWRSHSIKPNGEFDLVSRESFLLINNVVLITAMFTVLLGTLYPLALDALNLGKISVGPPYFDSVFFPLMAPMLLLMGLAPTLRWHKSALWESLTQSWTSLSVALVASIVTLAWNQHWQWLSGLGFFLAYWLMLTSLKQIFLRLKTATIARGLAVFRSQSASWWGMQLAHFGVAVFVLGVTMVKSFEVERDLRLAPGQKVTVADIDFQFEQLRPITGPNWQATEAQFTVSRHAETLAHLSPQKRRYNASGMVMTQAAIAYGITRDLYVSMGEPLPDNSWGLRIYIKPFIDWIWGGAALIALGGIIAMCDKRYRSKKQRPSPHVELHTTMTGIAASTENVGNPPLPMLR